MAKKTKVVEYFECDRCDAENKEASLCLGNRLDIVPQIKENTGGR
jgi:hypothetical protein